MTLLCQFNEVWKSPLQQYSSEKNNTNTRWNKITKQQQFVKTFKPPHEKLTAKIV